MKQLVWKDWLLWDIVNRSSCVSVSLPISSYFLQNPHFPKMRTHPIIRIQFLYRVFPIDIQSISLSSLAEKKNIVSSVHRQQHGQGGLSATRQQVNKLRLESRWSRMLRTTWTHLVQRAARRAGCWEPQAYIFNQASFQSIRASFQPTQRFNHRWNPRIVETHKPLQSAHCFNPRIIQTGSVSIRASFQP